MRRILPAFLFFCSAPMLSAQVVQKTVSANVGEPLATSGYTINFTIGEPLVGLISNEMTIEQGFWAGGLLIGPLGPVENFDGIFIYPNPVEDVLTISTNNAEIVGITLFAVNGQRVLKQKMNAQQLAQRIDLSYVAKGVYVLRLYIKGGTKGKLFKIIKK